MFCTQCPRRCGNAREEGKGFCGLKDEVKIALAKLHFGEEPIISGNNGSGTIFFSGCNLHCVFCQNHELSHENFGKVVSVERLAEIFKELESKGAHNINLVTPTPYVDYIIKALNIYRPNIPIVYNTNGYESVESLEKLKDYIDIYLTDLKYVDDALAQKYSSCHDYFDVTTKAILQMRKNIPQDIVEEGLMKKGIIVRHLVLPNNTNDSIKVLDWIKDNLGVNTYISVMGQYTPLYKACDFKEINRTITPLEYKRVLTHFNTCGFQNGFAQELDSAGTNEIPHFDLKGV